MSVPSCILYIVVDRMIVCRTVWKAAACASVSVRLGARKTSPTRRSSNLRGGTTVKLTGSNLEGCFNSMTRLLAPQYLRRDAPNASASPGLYQPIRLRCSVCFPSTSYPSAILSIRAFASASFNKPAVTRTLSARSRQCSGSVTRKLGVNIALPSQRNRFCWHTMKRVANNAAFPAAAALVILASFAIQRAFLADLFAFAGKFLLKFN
jgi:hypothetical protein